MVSHAGARACLRAPGSAGRRSVPRGSAAPTSKSPRPGPRPRPGRGACGSPTSCTGATPAAVARASTPATWHASWWAWATRVEVFAGQPWPVLDDGRGVHPGPGPRPVPRPRPLPGAASPGVPLVGGPARVRRHVHGRVPRAQDVLAPGPTAAGGTARRLRHRPRQPVPGIGPARDDGRTGGRCSPPCTTPSPSTGSWPSRMPRTPTAASPNGVGSGSWACRCGWRSSCRAS